MFKLPEKPRLMLPLSLLPGEDDFLEPAFAAALDLCHKLGAKLHLVTALGPGADFTKLIEEDKTFHETMAGLRDQAMRVAGARLERLAARAVEAGIVCSSHVLLRQAPAALAIMEEAEQQDLDLILMPTHSRRGLRRFLIGSVAERVAREAEVSVLLLRVSSQGTAPV